MPLQKIDVITKETGKHEIKISPNDLNLKPTNKCNIQVISHNQNKLAANPSNRRHSIKPMSADLLKS
jgi:hypothetical protein